jgi:hypothetical protein
MEKLEEAMLNWEAASTAWEVEVHVDAVDSGRLKKRTDGFGPLQFLF